MIYGIQEEHVSQSDTSRDGNGLSSVSNGCPMFNLLSEDKPGVGGGAPFCPVS